MNFRQEREIKSRNYKRKYREDSIAVARKTTFHNNNGSELLLVSLYHKTIVRSTTDCHYKT